MGEDIIRNLAVPALLLVLPLLAVQMRLLSYGHRQGLLDALSEAVPHDLSLIGMTLGIGAASVASRELTPLLMAAAFVPLFVTALLPSLPRGRSIASPVVLLRVFLGIMAYSVGVAAFLFVARPEILDVLR